MATSIYRGSAFRVEVLEDGFVELVFDLENESVNKLNNLALKELPEVLSILRAQTGARGLMITSAKDRFIVGADITEFDELFPGPGEDPERFTRQVTEAHALFCALETLPFPTTVAINGTALGGGFELALACDFRVMSTDARVGLPEVKIGIFPGWGGTVRLPRIVGLETAIDWICSGKDQDAEAALKTGAVDAIVEPASLRSSALEMLGRAANGQPDFQARRKAKREPIKLEAAERNRLFEHNRAALLAKSGPHYPAPVMALEAMQAHTGLALAEALRVETEYFVKVVQTDSARSLIGLFLNQQFLRRASRHYSESGHDVETLAVLGAGIMGGGIAYQAALNGTPVVMKDIRSEALELGRKEAGKLLAKQVDGGRMAAAEAADILDRIQGTLVYDELKDVDFAIEAVVENSKVKQSVLAELEEVVNSQAVIASNTSTISIDDLAAGLKHPGRFCGMHFFNPVHVMPLVEVIRGEATDESTIATTVKYARALGKNPIVVNNCPGFLVNRILFPYFNAFELLLRDGAEFHHVDGVMEDFGWPMGPAYLMDVVGIDTGVHAASIVANAYPDRMKLDFKTSAQLLYESGRLGQKTGSGYYTYERSAKGKPQKAFDPSAAEFIAAVRSEQASFTDQEIVDRMMIPMCLETVRCLEDGIVDSAAAADMGLVWGLGFPPFRGGALRYIDSVGAGAFCAAAERFETLGDAYRPTAGLLALAESGGTYF